MAEKKKLQKEGIIVAACAILTIASFGYIGYKMWQGMPPMDIPKVVVTPEKKLLSKSLIKPPATEISVTEPHKAKETHRNRKGRTRPLTPPSERGLIVLPDEAKPETQQEWNAFIGKRYAQYKQRMLANVPSGGKENFTEAEKETQKEAAGMIEKVDKQIAAFAARVRREPNSEDAKDDLEKMMIAKACLTAVNSQTSP